eukprot:TRINITY_DN4234_c0_g1_i8.p1 TRINITY_DN4234_c0_g1~~TRINITY_DN4234_c0_g1_i8.p1  ORF type:complete len:285 (+),score=59.17 TRINITY_DN4234_c0_g1_i8:387-1241(+)
MEIVQLLLASGAAWNSTDGHGKTIGEYAKERGHYQIYEEMLNAGIRTELLFSCIAKKNSEPPDNHYLTQGLQYVDDKLLDANGNGVMMGWEEPLMRLHAEKICTENVKGECKGTGDILNIGFGLGIIDRYIQSYSPCSHTIVEAHPDVYSYMIEKGWDKKKGVKIIFGKWQDVIHELGFFDGIFFDTYSENYQQLKEFHEYLGDHLKPGGTYSYFNGLAATNSFFHEVYREVVKLELKQMHNIIVEFIQVPIQPDEVTWEGVARKYWTLDVYFLPVCRWREDVD